MIAILMMIFLIAGVIALLIIGGELLTGNLYIHDIIDKGADVMGKTNINGAQVLGAGCFVLVLFVAWLFGGPVYTVWQQNKVGEAELARAEQNRQIAIQEARAKEESAKSLANAEVIRAEGVAKANMIIGDSLKNNDAYIHYLWIEAIRESSSDVIYIPTEAGIPITESSRFHISSERRENRK